MSWLILAGYLIGYITLGILTYKIFLYQLIKEEFYEAVEYGQSNPKTYAIDVINKRISNYDYPPAFAIVTFFPLFLILWVGYFLGLRISSFFNGSIGNIDEMADAIEKRDKKKRPQHYV